MPATISASTPWGPIRLTCQVFTTAGRFPWYFLQRETEELIARGVDGTRLRIPRLDYPRYTADIAVGCATYYDAVLAQQQMIRLRGRTLAIDLTGGGLVLNCRNVLCHDVANPTANPTELLDASAATFPAHATCSLTLQLTEDP